MKLFLHITQDEQLRRFEERLRDPLKRWKLSYDDFRNRRNWPHYQQAVEDMVERTSTQAAPWHVIPANDKKYARIACIRIVTETLPPMSISVRRRWMSGRSMKSRRCWAWTRRPSPSPPRRHPPGSARPCSRRRGRARAEGRRSG